MRKGRVRETVNVVDADHGSWARENKRLNNPALCYPQVASQREQATRRSISLVSEQLKNDFSQHSSIV